MKRGGLRTHLFGGRHGLPSCTDAARLGCPDGPVRGGMKGRLHESAELRGRVTADESPRPSRPVCQRAAGDRIRALANLVGVMARPRSAHPAEDGAEAIDPVNVAGQHPAATQDAAVPTARIPNTRTPTEEPPPVTSAQATVPPTTPVPPTTQSGDISQIPGPTPTLTPTVETQPTATQVPAAAAAGATGAAAGAAAATPATATPATAATPVETAPAAAAAVPAAATASTTESTSTAPATALTIPARPAATIPASSAVATSTDGKSYPLTGVRIDYFKQHPAQPPVADLLNMPVKLGVTKDGLVAPRAGLPTVTLRLGDVGKSDPQRIYRSGIGSIYGQVVRFFQ